MAGRPRRATPSVKERVVIYLTPEVQAEAEALTEIHDIPEARFQEWVRVIFLLGVKAWQAQGGMPGMIQSAAAHPVLATGVAPTARRVADEGGAEPEVPRPPRRVPRPVVAVSAPKPRPAEVSPPVPVPAQPAAPVVVQEAPLEAALTAPKPVADAAPIDLGDPRAVFCRKVGGMMGGG